MSNFWKVPPKIKVFEALGAISDERVKLIDEKNAEVLASKGNRKYTIIYDESRNAIYSDDNGSVFKGYLGYPSIAFLMLKGKLSFNEDYGRLLRKIPWKDLNEKYKNYSLVIGIVKQIVEKRNGDFTSIDEFANKVIKEIKERRFMKLDIKDRRISDFS